MQFIAFSGNVLSTAMVPGEYKRVYSKAQIAAKVAELGAVISSWAEEARSRTGDDPIIVPLLRGALFFSADLIRCIQGSVEVAPLATESYDESRNQPLAHAVVGNVDVSRFKGRALVIVDDVCDSGRTLESVVRKCRDAGAAEVRSAVMVNRVTTATKIVPEWIGFEFKGDDWFVGYGMDDSGRYRNLPEIYVMRKPAA